MRIDFDSTDHRLVPPFTGNEKPAGLTSRFATRSKRSNYAVLHACCRVSFALAVSQTGGEAVVVSPRPVITNGDQSFNRSRISSPVLYPLSYTAYSRGGIRTRDTKCDPNVPRQNPFTEHTPHNPSGAVRAAGPDGSCRQKQKAPSASHRRGSIESALVERSTRRGTSGAFGSRLEALDR